jgi:DNA repair protein RadC
MKTVAPHDRPREKLHRLGAGALGDNELVAIVLGEGGSRAGALDLANAILSRAGGVDRLARACTEDLTCIPGIGPARAAQVLAAIELGRRTLTRIGRERLQVTTPRSVAELLLPQFGSRPVEHFGAVLLDTKHRVLQVVEVSAGTLDGSLVHPREGFREAVAARAAAVVLFHNHPSGDPAPSPDDVEITRRMMAAGQVLGIEVLDHVILADVRFCSLRERKCL